MPSGQEDAFLAAVVQQVTAHDPAQAQLLRQNAYRSGFLRKSPTQTTAGGRGCGMTLLVILATVACAIAFCAWPW